MIICDECNCELKYCEICKTNHHADCFDIEHGEYE